MGRSGEATKARIVADAYRLFYREGYARVTMDAIAAASGVTKRTVYQHFDSKDALLGAILEAQRADAIELIRSWAGAPKSEAELIEAMFVGLERWAARPRWLGSGFTRLSLELADLPGHPARRIAGRHKQEVEDWLAGTLDALAVREPAVRAREMMMLMEGCACLMLIHGDRGYAAAARDAALRLARGAPE